VASIIDTVFYAGGRQMPIQNKRLWFGPSLRDLGDGTFNDGHQSHAGQTEGRKPDVRVLHASVADHTNKQQNISRDSSNYGLLPSGIATTKMDRRITPDDYEPGVRGLQGPQGAGGHAC